VQPGRPKEFDQDRAIGAALELFWAHGYETTSLRQLLDGMGIGRSSFYQAFGSKETLFLLAVARYREWLAGRLQVQLTTADSGFQFLKAVLSSVADDCAGPGARRGCLVFNSAVEFGQSNPVVASEISASLDAFSAVFSAAVARAQREGDLAADLDPMLLGRYLVGA